MPGLGPRLVRWRRPVLALVALLTLGALLTLIDFSDPRDPRPRLRIDPTVDRLLDPNSAARAFQRSTGELFGAEQRAVLAVAGPDYYSDTGLALLREVHAALLALPQIRSVESLATAPHAALDEDGFLAIEPFARLPAGDASERAALRSAIAGNPLVGGQLISDEGRVAAFVLQFADPAAAQAAFAEADFVPGLKSRVRALAPGPVEVWVTGPDVVKAGVSRSLASQLQYMVPLVLLLTALITALAFRSLRGALLTLLTIGIALSWTLACLVLLDIPLTLISAIMPPVVITLGLAYAMHVLSTYFGRERARSPDQPPEVATAAAIDSLKLPLVLTGLTTIAGFLALLLNPLTAVKEFAALSALGIGIDVLLALCVLPLLLQTFHCRPKRPRSEDAFETLASKLAAFSLRHRRAILWGGALVLLLGLLSLTRIEVGTNYVRSFDPEHPVRADFERINAELGGVNSFSIVLEGFVDDTFTEPEVLRAVQRLQAWLREQPEVGASVSLVDHLRLIQQGFGDAVNGDAVIPESREQTKQLLLFGASPALHTVVDRRLATSRIVVRTYEENSALVKSLLDRLEQRLQQLPRRLDATLTGDAVLLTETVADIASGQWLTVGVAALVVFVMLATLFTSWRVAALAMLPNLLPIAVYYGLLGLFDVPLNPTTSLIACIVLGVAVDDTIHFLVRFNTASRSLANEPQAVAVALRAVLRPVTFTTVALCAGFSVLCLSPLQNQVQFGALAAATLAFAWVGDVLFTPALGSGIRLVTLWDVLRLDLGQDPQLSIPLFADLSGRQARTFALMSRIQEVPAGARVITQGDVAEDIFVIIDGRLRAFLDREEGPRELSMMERGTVMGEVGYFGQKRTASVEAMTPARLLVFNGSDLDALRRRYPRIAATVYRNLNLAQAQRLANMAKMI